ncbi:hypothetical protein [Prevotellamassilia timonensis]|uniref:hypothetical protein n=1 Tax=Prevotellamassilia timonensis TaxID=1852370 RepID=UPI001F4361ED|nr:hypothetical protein [Prevotellamassilia timonensis]MCF2634837.1 hypothetical protein [Prevotellamassilia timonensis]
MQKYTQSNNHQTKPRKKKKTKKESEHPNRKRGTDTNESAKQTKARKESTVQTQKRGVCPLKKYTRRFVK